MVRSIEFKSVRNNFQSILREDLNKIKSSRNLLVFADKTTNFYEMPPVQNKTLLNNSITKTYWEADSNAKRNVDKEAKKLSKELNLEDKMECFLKRPAFFTLKDHKENFKSNQKSLLINPCKSEMGIVSKKYLKNIISKLNIKLQYNQCRNTFTVIEWFKATKYKAKCRFTKFDIDEFYPSISIELLDRSISFAKFLIYIDGNIINTINHARKSWLFDDSGAWVKKDGNPLFDVAMGNFVGAEVCELVGLHLLNKIKFLLGSNNVGWYRDDRLAIVHKANDSKVDRLRKDIINLFKDERLSITIDTNLIEADFLDVSFNLNTGKYFSFKKPNNTPPYIRSKSTHLPSIIKELPSMTNKRISSLSCDETEFNKAKITYEMALKNNTEIRENLSEHKMKMK